MILLLATLLLAPYDYEGDWFVSDTTDNNSGERSVDAFQSVFKPDYITLRMQCWEKKPAFFVDWDGQSFPDVTVLSIGPVKNPDAEPAGVRYVFEKSTDAVARGLRASPETSKAIVAAIGAAPYTTVTAHLPSGPKIVGFEIKGTQQAWSRVVRHCPATIMPKPPK
jgi:hypothetical protein